MTFKSLFTGVVAAVALAGSAQGAAIVDTGTPDNQAPWNLTADQWLGSQFRLDRATTITEILGYMEGTADEALTLAIHRDDDTGIPGAELFSRALVFDGSRGFHGLSGLSWALDAGSYYVTAEVRRGQAFVGAMPGFAPHALGHEVFTQGGQWLGADGLDLGWRISDAAVAPEPGAWLLLTGGLGLAGAMLRRRRMAVAA